MKRRTPIYLNHVAQTSRLGMFGHVMFCLGAAALLTILGVLQVLHADIHEKEQALAASRQPAAIASQGSMIETAAKSEEIQAVTMVMDELAMPWEALFSTLEHLQSPDIRIAALEPNVQQRKLRLTANAADVEAMLEFVGVLEKQPILADVRLLSQEHEGNDASVPLAFVMEATWRI